MHACTVCVCVCSLYHVMCKCFWAHDWIHDLHWSVVARGSADLLSVESSSNQLAALSRPIRAQLSAAAAPEDKRPQTSDRSEDAGALDGSAHVCVRARACACARVCS